MKDDVREKKWVTGVFHKRLNRFSAQVCIENAAELTIVHVANTARLKELLVPDASVLLTHEPKESRKTEYTLRKVAMADIWVSIDSNEPNKLVRDWLEQGQWRIPGISWPVVVASEVKWGHSRFDLSLPESGMLIEVKGVSLIKEGFAMFPDAPTTRGVKHLNELSRYVEEGGRAAIVFVCQRGDAQRFKPHGENDPEFASALRRASGAGVEIYVLKCLVTETGGEFTGEIPWSLEEDVV